MSITYIITYIITNKGMGIIVSGATTTGKATANFMVPNPPGVWDCD